MVPFSNLFVGTLLRRSFASSRGFLDPALASGKSIASRLLSKTIGSIFDRVNHPKHLWTCPYFKSKLCNMWVRETCDVKSSN